ncbi:MAG: Gfo/Idh/MocA family oxidoreductase [Candidatus Omnitrophica bacterium]|jgi:predicted dehydrogenase|nr:Gfo/Idh/MocA family oxidoreductase [Candidatus Omnitrophota bacterium]
MEKVKVGIIGCGNISSVYFKKLKESEITDIVACADIIKERAQKKAEEFGIPKVYSVDELLSDKEIEIVVNLTIPISHYEIAITSLKSGKSTYSEKPLAINKKQGKEIVKIAKQKKLYVGSAPDTFLGAGIQTCIKIINDGIIGEPISATAFCVGHGHESWHPDPEFYYKIGGGPLFDMGPYYLTALINLIGPVKSVMGFTKITFPERTITSQPKSGTKIIVEVPTHITGLLEFENGAIGTVITSFDVWASNLPLIEIHGTKGSISVPDPNGFGGEVKIFTEKEKKWQVVPLTHKYAEQNRGLGVEDMAYAIRTNRKHRANGNLAFHVLDIMESLHESSDKGKRIILKSTCEKSKPMPEEGLYE